MNLKFYILFSILFCPILLTNIKSQDIQSSYSYLWVKHDNNTSELIHLFQRWQEDTKYGNHVYKKYVTDKGDNYYCRIDDKKMKRYDVNKGIEFVLCDFGLEEGDCFETYDGRILHVVEKGDTAFSNILPAYNFQRLVNEDNPDETDLWIENYGSLYTSILTPSELGDDVVESHTLFDYVGPMINVFHSEYIQTQLMVIDKVEDYYVYDESNQQMLQTPDSLSCRFCEDTLVISGRLKREGTNLHYLSCETDGDIIHFRVYDLPSWTSTPKDYYFTAKFPGFKPGKYIVNYDDDIYGVENVINMEVVMPAKTNYPTIPILVNNSGYGEKTWILKSIGTDINGKRSVSTHYITNMYAESVKVNGMDCIDLREPVKDDNGNIVFRHYIFNESNGMIYRYDEDDKILYKCYDFTLQEGGVINCLNGSGYEVTSIGQASDYAPYWSPYCPNRRMMYMHRLDTDGDDVWIEGIGSVHTGIYKASDFNSSEVYVQSMMHGYDDCAFFSIDTDIFKSRPFLGEEISPADPYMEQLIEENHNGKTNFELEFINDTLHVKGGLFTETRSSLKTLEVIIEDYEITLFVTEPTLSRTTTGIPIRFDVKIPGFKAGSYQIRYYGRNPVKDVVCHGTATSITSITDYGKQLQPNTLYDLSGRRLTSPPERGIYIQGGKLRMK